MRKGLPAAALADAVRQYGADVLASGGMAMEKGWIQHGSVSVFAHSFAVACLALWLAQRLNWKVDRRSLVRGALLHDYFLYDWHQKDPSHRFHGLIHARRALENAQREFPLNPVERDIVLRHMFPLNLTPPHYRESVLVCAADKLCALWETLSVEKFLAAWAYESGQSAEK